MRLLPTELTTHGLTLLMLACVVLGGGGVYDNVEGNMKSSYRYHSFQVAVRAGETDCFYQNFDKNTSSSLLWHVISAGGAGELAAVVTMKNVQTDKYLYISAYGQLGDHREENLDEGTYEFCIDNKISYTSKVVYLWIDHQHAKEWDQVIDEDEDIKKYNFKKDLIKDILRTLEYKLHDMSYYQAVYREKNQYHEASLLNLESAINTRSLLAFVLMITTAALQVIFVRKLFSNPSTKQTNAGI